MTADEARILTSQCKVYNDERNYDYAISKIIPMCSAGQSYVLMDRIEIYNSTLERLVSEGYKVEMVEAIDLIRIRW